LGLLLEAREDVAPRRGDAFVVVDTALLVQAMSEQAEQLLGICETLAVNRPLTDLLVPADAEVSDRSGLAPAVLEAIGGESEPTGRFVRPRNTFGVRVRARIAACGPPRAALIVLADDRAARLRAVEPG
jgi:hypothetical protein